MFGSNSFKNLNVLNITFGVIKGNEKPEISIDGIVKIIKFLIFFETLNSLPKQIYVTSCF